MVELSDVDVFQRTESVWDGVQAARLPETASIVMTRQVVRDMTSHVDSDASDIK